MSEQSHKEREHFFGAAKLVAGVTILSRFAGMLRAAAIASLGANEMTDAFGLAFKVPNLFRRLFAEGALSAAFVPVFSEVDERDGHARAAALLSNAMGLLSVFLLVLMIVVQAGLAAWSWLWPGAADRQLAMMLTSVMMPFMVTVCMLALAAAALNARGHFLYPAATPILLNLVIVAAAWFVAPLWKQDLAARLTVISASVSAAGVLQLLGVLWVLRRAGFSLRMKLRPIQPGIRAIVRLMGPVLLGLGFLQLSELAESLIAFKLRVTADEPTISLFGQVLAKPLDAGVIQRIDAARYLYQFPLGVLAISLGVAVFPLISRYAARGDLPNLRDAVNRALRLSFMEGMATGAGLFILAEPITRVLYVHGAFTPADAALSAFVLRMYCLGMWAYCTYQILARAFYAMKDTRTPLKVSCVMAALHLLLVAGLVWVPALGPGSFGVATAGVFSLNVLILAYLLRRRLGRLGGRHFAASAARTLAACAVMTGVIYAMRWQFDRMGASDWLDVAACVPAGGAAFILTAWLLRAPELGELWGAARSKLKGKKADADSVQ